MNKLVVGTPLFAVILLILPAFSTLAFADEGILDVGLETPLLFSLDGAVEIVGDPNQSKPSYTIEAVDRGDRPITGLSIDAKPDAKGVRLILAKQPGTPAINGDPKIKVVVNPLQPILLNRVTGNYTIHNNSSVIRGEFREGKLIIDRSTGEVDLEVDKGSVEVLNLKTEGKPFFLKMNQGRIKVEVTSDHPGPGDIVLKNGRVYWMLLKPAPLRFYTHVGQGLINCNLNVLRKAQDSFFFSSMNGESLWTVDVQNGAVDIKLPEPKDKPKKIFF